MCIKTVTFKFFCPYIGNICCTVPNHFLKKAIIIFLGRSIGEALFRNNSVLLFDHCAIDENFPTGSQMRSFVILCFEVTQRELELMIVQQLWNCARSIETIRVSHATKGRTVAFEKFDIYLGRRSPKLFNCELICQLLRQLCEQDSEYDLYESMVREHMFG